METHSAKSIVHSAEKKIKHRVHREIKRNTEKY